MLRQHEEVSEQRGKYSDSTKKYYGNAEVLRQHEEVSEQRGKYSDSTKKYYGNAGSTWTVRRKIAATKKGTAGQGRSAIAKSLRFTEELSPPPTEEGFFVCEELSHR